MKTSKQMAKASPKAKKPAKKNVKAVKEQAEKTPETKPTKEPHRAGARVTVPPMNTDRPGGRPNDLTWHPVFVAALAKDGTIKAACAAAGITRSTYDEHRVKFPELAQAVENVLVECVDEADRELYRRAVEGTLECVGSDNEGVPIMVMKKSDRLLEFYLKGRRREVYGDKSKLELSGNPSRDLSRLYPSHVTYLNPASQDHRHRRLRRPHLAHRQGPPRQDHLR